MTSELMKFQFSLHSATTKPNEWRLSIHLSLSELNAQIIFYFNPNNISDKRVVKMEGQSGLEDKTPDKGKRKAVPNESLSSGEDSEQDSFGNTKKIRITQSAVHDEYSRSSEKK